VPDEELDDLLRRSQFVIEATVRAHERSTESDIPVDDHTVVVGVDRVLHAPAALAGAVGSEVTVQLLPGSAVPAVGGRLVLFTTAVAFGRGIAVAEVGRSEPEAVGGTVMAAGRPANIPGARPGRPHPVLEAAERLQDEQLRAHADQADAVVVGRVVAVEKAGPPVITEHDADWWRATIEVHQVEQGEVGDRVEVLFANSSDVRWAALPKPSPGQDALFLLHATSGEQADLARFAILDTEDVQQADHVDRLSQEPS
jgi:hypothetical protein